MFKFCIKRMASAVPLILLLPLLTLLLMQLAPGNYFDSLRMNPQISPDTIEKYAARYHLDEPVIVQYSYWVKNLLHFDLGYSFAYQQQVTDLLKSRMLNTLLLTVTSFIFAWGLAIPCGLIAGLKPSGKFDRILSIISYGGLSVPGFFLCLILLFAAAQTGTIPLGGIRSLGYAELSIAGKIMDIGSHMFIPVAVLSLGSFCYLFRIMRAQTIEISRKEFVLFLKACNVPKLKIIFRHILRNSVNPMITMFGLELPVLFSGSALVEIFTGWPGLGQMMLYAARAQDMFLVLGNMVMIAVLLVLGSFVADILLVLTDPRIRFSGGAKQ